MVISNPMTTSNDNISYEIEVDETSSSSSTNSSVVRVKVYAWSTKTGFSVDYDGECYLKIDGEPKATNSWSRTQKPIVNGYANKVTLYDGTFTVQHNSSGEKTIQVAACFELYFDGYVKVTSNFKAFNVNLTSLDVASSLDTVDLLDIDGNTNHITMYTRVAKPSSYTHSLTLSDGETTVLSISGLSLSNGVNTHTLTSSEKSTISTYMSNAGITSFVCAYTLTTYAGSTIIGSSSICKGTVRTPLSNGTPLVEFRSGSVKVNGAITQTVPNMEIKDGHILKILRW